MKYTWLTWACVVAWLIVTAGAAAQDVPPPEPATRFDPATGAFGEADQARGWAEAPGAEDEDVALFVPRSVLLLPKLVLTAVFWLPEQGMRLVDHYHLIERAERVLYFDDAHEFGWTPLVSYQSGDGPTGGVKLFHQSLFGNGEKLALSGAYGGKFTQSYRGSLYADRVAGSRLWLDTEARFEAQPGTLFGGFGIAERDASGDDLGPRDANRLTYFSQDRVLGLLRLGYTSGERRRLVKVGATAIFNHREFGDNVVDKLQLASVYDPARIPGFTEDVTTLELQANLVLDFREHRGLDPRGAYFEAFAGGVPELGRYRYAHYGLEVAYTFDLYRATRLLRVRAALEAVEAGEMSIPFTDLPRLGGSHRLRGYREAEFRDERAALASVEYQYPVHKNLHGHLFVDAGYVAQHYRDLFELGRWKVGFGGGILIGSPDDISFRFDLAYGEDPQIYVSTGIAQAFDARSEQL